jgi:uncharacterized protein YjbI with pentapeptide repeats
MGRVSLVDADLSGADLTGARLNGADLTGADLSGANLSFADLSGANLSGANLSESYLKGADLSGADLDGADLSRAAIHYVEHTYNAEIKTKRFMEHTQFEHIDVEIIYHAPFHEDNIARWGNVLRIKSWSLKHSGVNKQHLNNDKTP